MDNRSTPPEEGAQLLKNYISAQMPAIRDWRAGCLAKLLWSPVLGVACLALLYVGVVLIAPWSLHIGRRWTPFLTWHGYGQLHTKDGGEYPLYVSFYPSSHFGSSGLRLNGLRSTGGLQGSGWICTSRGAAQYLDLSGTIYGGWRSTDNSLMEFRLHEHRIVDTGGYWGFFDLRGRWHGPELVMNERGDHGEVGAPFRSGLRVDYASVAFGWGSYSQFKAACAARK